MTLVNRVSAFFLLALAIALIGFSSLLCILVYYSLQRQFSDQLHSALNTLVAAVEVEDDDVKWEPSDHTIALGAHHELDDVRWAVFDEHGQIVDHSRNLSPHQPADACAPQECTLAGSSRRRQLDVFACPSDRAPPQAGRRAFAAGVFRAAGGRGAILSRRANQPAAVDRAGGRIVARHLVRRAPW